jgi:FAD/FMN-containing dehydrogenase
VSEEPNASAGDDDWGGAVIVWNGIVASVPALVVAPTSQEDVAAAVAFARDHGLLLRVARAGESARANLAERCLTIDASRVRADVDLSSLG